MLNDWLPRIEGLRCSLLDAAQGPGRARFSRLQRDFLSLLETGEFLVLGQPADPPPVRALIDQSVAKLTDRRGQIKGLVLIRIPTTTFTYGCFMVQGMFGSVFWFTDLHQGLLSLGPIRGPTRLVHIKGIPVGEGLGMIPAGVH
ncbi:MAG: hypothetical protein AAFV53_34890 [Myxococcota bacterium]